MTKILLTKTKNGKWAVEVDPNSIFSNTENCRVFDTLSEALDYLRKIVLYNPPPENVG
jgi:hypothetical protein